MICCYYQKWLLQRHLVRGRQPKETRFKDCGDYIKIKVTDHLFLFMYANPFLMKCALHFNIQYLFICLFKAMSTTAAQVTTFVYLLMQMACWLHVLFILILSIYLFIYSKWCKQQQRKSPRIFIYLWKWIVLTHGFRFNIQCLFVYLFEAMSTKAGGSDDLYLLMEITCWLHVVFVLILSIYLFIYSKWCQQKQCKSPRVFIYLWKWIVLTHGFRFNIQCLFVYLFKAM